MTLRRPRPSVRLRLALTYTALFVVTGSALLGVSYILVQHRESGPATAAQIICTRSVEGHDAGSFGGVIAGQASGALSVSPAACAGVVGTFYYHASGGGASGAAIGLPSGVASNGQAIPGPTAAAVRQLTAAVSASQAHTLHSFRIESAIALGFITIVSFGLSWWMAGRVLRPVHRITDAARRLSEETLHNRINLQGPNDELKELADTFDAMLARLDRAFHSQRRFVANASHELRTPLATERVLIDEALANRSARPGDYRAILEQLRSNSQETERLVDALLVLARTERGIERPAAIDLAAAAGAVVARASGEAERNGVEIRSFLSSATVEGDPSLVERMIGNLVENGIRHNHRGGWVEVRTSCEVTRAVLEVINSGPALDPATVATLTEPFRRAGPQRSASDGGFGLGLSIVDGVVSSHRGSLMLRPRAGGGLTAAIELPAAGGPVKGTRTPSGGRAVPVTT